MTTSRNTSAGGTPRPRDRCHLSAPSRPRRIVCVMNSPERSGRRAAASFGWNPKRSIAALSRTSKDTVMKAPSSGFIHSLESTLTFGNPQVRRQNVAIIPPRSRSPARSRSAGRRAARLPSSFAADWAHAPESVPGQPTGGVPRSFGILTSCRGVIRTRLGSRNAVTPPAGGSTISGTTRLWKRQKHENCAPRDSSFRPREARSTSLAGCRMLRISKPAGFGHVLRYR